MNYSSFLGKDDRRWTLPKKTREIDPVCGLHDTDILMVVHSRPEYLHRALGTLLANINRRARVWIWQNGEDSEVREVVDSFSQNETIARYCQSRQNVGLREPINWLLSNSTAKYFGKVDDDCLIPVNWLEALIDVHQSFGKLAILSAWNYGPEDFDGRLAEAKLRVVGGWKVMLHPWVGGGSFIAKAEPLRRLGLLEQKESFPNYCIRLAWRGWLNGWCVPPMLVDHMDDPRSTFTLFKSDNDVARFASLTMKESGVSTREDWIKVIQRAARSVQVGPILPGRLFWPRMILYRLLETVRRA